MTSPTRLKKFYKIAEAGTAPGGYAIRLDGKIVRTPLTNPLLLASRGLAEAIAEEWAAQGNEIKPLSMPLTQLANTMMDKAKGDDRRLMNTELAGYAASDLVCYFATHPVILVNRQKEYWLPVIEGMKEKHGIILETISGIQYHHQPEESLKKMKSLIEGLDAADFTVVQAAAATAGSVAIAFGLLDRLLSPEAAYQAACVDEIYQLEQWGEDTEARKRLDVIKSELISIARFRDLVKATT